MLVSGKNVIAIDGVKTGNTLKGDGVFNTPGSKLDVNTDVIATKEFVTTEDDKVVGKINAASATLSSKIDEVSSKLTTSAETLSANKQDKLEFEGDHNRITAIGPSGGTLSSVGGNVVDVKAGNSTTVTTATDEETGLTTYTVSLTAEPTDTIVSGENGITSRQNGNTFFVGLSSTYENAIKKVSSISADVTALSSYKLDTTAYKPETFYPMEGNPSGFLTQQSLNNYYNKTEVDNKFTATSSWANTTFLTKNSADGLYYPLNTNPNGYLTESDISADKWNSVYTTVNTASGGWNLISSVSALTGIQNFKQLLIYKEGQQGVQYTIDANGSAASLSFVQGDNISLTTAGESIKLSAKDTTYSSGNHIVISGDNNSINAVGLQPSGDYVSATDFDEFKDKVEDEFEQTSAWVERNFLSANALDEIKNLSAKWDAASDEVTSHSANWNSVYETVQTNSGDWEEITKVKTFKTIGGIEAETSADSLEFSAGENIKIGITEDKKIYISSHDTTYDENDFISASHLDNIVSVSANVTSNSADWTSAARALEASADKWNTTHEQFNTSSVKWNELYDEYQVSSKLWNDTTDVVNTFSAIWNEVSAKANSADLEELSGKVETLSGELETASSFIEGQIDYLSAAIDDNSDDIDYLSGAIEDKLDKDDFDTWSADADVTPYSAGKGLALNGHEFYVSADYAMSADVYNKDEVDEKIANFGGYTTANADASGYPSVVDPSNKLIYLVKMSNLPASSDNYKEWIYSIDTSVEPATGKWECVGETTLDLTPYLTKDEAAHTYQPSGYYVTSSTNEISAVDEYYGLINDGSDNVQWAKIPVRDTTYTAGKNIVISGVNNEISVSGLHNTIVSSQNGSIAISSIPDANGNITYNLSVQTVPDISGTNGVSAYYDEGEDQYVVGLDDYNDIGFAKYSSSANVYTASAVVDGYTEDLNVNPTKITFYDDQILLKTGFYHVDVQTNFTITNPDNNYYNVFVKSIPNAASITQMIDGSYAHTETVDLSFDIRITNDDTPLEISVEYFKTNETFAISNLNIHEIVSMPSQIEGGAGNYQAGNGISIGNNTIEAKIGNGLEFNESNAIQVKLGEGLAFTDDQGIKAISIDPAGDVAEVVKSVEALQDELDTKITDNFPPAMITLADLQVATGTQYAPSNGGMLIGYLFTCPITHNIYVNNEKYQTKIGIYTKQWSGDNKKVILGIYEYDPDYNEGGQVGKTEALCDTGIIELQQGYAEYEIKNVGEKTTPIMTPGKFYYATIYLSYLAGDTNGITLFGAPGYNTQVNNLKPGITITNVNCIRASLYDNMTGYDPNLNFDKMGFSWEYNSYPPTSTTDPTTSQGIVEAHAAGRPYFAIRNVKK